MEQGGVVIASVLVGHDGHRGRLVGERARETFEALLEVDPSSHWAHFALAESLQRETLRSVHRRWSDTESLGVKKGPFFVLVGAYMPCALVETGFLTNQQESSRLGTVAYQEALGDGIARGILSFLASGEANSNL